MGIGDMRKAQRGLPATWHRPVTLRGGPGPHSSQPSIPLLVPMEMPPACSFLFVPPEEFIYSDCSVNDGATPEYMDALHEEIYIVYCFPNSNQ